MTGIYIVDVTDVRNHQTARSIVLGQSATNVGARYDAEGVIVTVGRIGNYEPGITGAALAASSSELVKGVKPDEGDPRWQTSAWTDA